MCCAPGEEEQSLRAAYEAIALSVLQIAGIDVESGTSKILAQNGVNGKRFANGNAQLITDQQRRRVRQDQENKEVQEEDEDERKNDNKKIMMMIIIYNNDGAGGVDADDQGYQLSDN